MARLRCALSLCLAWPWLATDAPASPVQATVTSEARCAIFAGAADGTDLQLVAANAPPAAWLTCSTEIPDEYYLFVATWGHPGPTRGFRGEFILAGVVVLSGDPAWEVCPASLPARPDDRMPSPSAVAAQIRSANRRFTWGPVARTAARSPNPTETDAKISAEAAWMWLPQADPPLAHGQSAGPVANAALFRISPNKLWPDIDLWHAKNAGRGALAGGAWGNSAFPGGGGGGGGASSAPGADTGGTAPPIRNPFPDFEPPNSYSAPGVPYHQDPTTPLLPAPLPSDTPTTPPGDNSQQDQQKPPVDDQPDQPPITPPIVPPVNPPVPEPSSLLLLIGAASLVRRR